MSKAKLLVMALVSVALVGCGGHKKKSPNASTTGAVTSNGTGTTTSGTTGTSSSGTTTGTSTPASTVTVSAISPDRGPLDGGTPLTITGTGFGTSPVFVLFGDQALVQVTPVSDTEIQVNAPIGKTATQTDVRVVTDTAQGLLASAWTYEARAAGLTVSPKVGHFEVGFGGTLLTLELERFVTLSPATVVTFDQTPATAVTLIDADTLQVEVPDGLSAGLVTITVDEAGQQATFPGFVVQGALAYGDLIVNEFSANPGGVDVNRDGTGSTSGDEFVEIVNTTAQPLDLSYLVIKDAVAQRHRFPNPTTVPAGGSIVVFGNGTPNGFAERHASGAPQQATSGLLGLNNTGDSISIETLPGPTGTPSVIFTLDYTATSVVIGGSVVNKADGQKITANPATDADFEPHSAAPGSTSDSSAGTKNDGSPF